MWKLRYSMTILATFAVGKITFRAARDALKNFPLIVHGRTGSLIIQ